MLVLSRMHNEAVIIGQGPKEVRILVTDIRGDKVRLGIDCHKSVPVHRQEVRDDIIRQGGELLERRVLLESIDETLTLLRDLCGNLGVDDRLLKQSMAADLLQLAQRLSPPLADKGEW